MPTTDSVSPSAIDRENPWPGLATFTEEQAGLFYGRDAEIRDLTKRAERNPLTVLFGQSGLGKSSLLQAGVFPRLRANSYWPIYIRLDHAPGAPTPTEQIKAMVQADTARAGTWTKSGAAVPGESLWEFFHHRDDRLVSATGKTIVPVLVFDQFEELFTLGAGGGAERARAVAFMSELAELVENRPSESLVARLEESSAEMEVFDFSRTDYRVVITLREDYLPHLESLKTTMPALMENRMRLARMTGAQALEAVVKPGGALVTEEVARAIVEFVAGAKGGSIERLGELDVEPPLLSVICRELNERRRKLGQAQITADLVSGNRREILTDFYERSVADLPEGMRTFVEDRLLTKSGFRDNLALETALEEPGVTQALIDTLVARRLLRIEDRIGVQRVELTHDVLAEVIRGSRDTRHQRRTLEETKQRERVTRRRMWLARTIAAGLLVGLTGVSWIAWRAISGEREQTRLRADADTARVREAALRVKAEADELAAKRLAYASDMNAVQRALDLDNIGRARALLDRHRPAPGEVDLRGWEWRYLWQFCRSDAREELQAGAGEVRAVAASADGVWLAAAGYSLDGVSFWNLRTKEHVRILPGRARGAVAFSPPGQLMAVLLDGGNTVADASRWRVGLWNLQTRRLEREMPINGFVRELSFSRDGRTLAVFSVTGQGGNQGEVTLWEVASGTPLATCSPGVVSGNFAFKIFAATPDLTVVAIVVGNNQVAVIDLKTGRELWRKPAADEIVSNVAISPDGTMLATGGGYTDGVIRLWELASGRELGRLAAHRAHIGDMQFSADGRRLVSCSGDQTVRLWDVAGRALLRTLRGHKTEVWRLALLPDQRTVVSGGKDGAVLLWDLETERAPNATGKLDTKQRAWAFADGGQAIVTVDAAGAVVLWQGRAFQDKASMLGVGEATRWVFAANHPRLAVATPENTVRVWDWASRTMLREISPPPDTRSVRPERFSDDASELAVVVAADEKNSVRVWEITTGRETGGFPIAAGTWRGGDYMGYRDRQWFAVQRTGERWLFSRPDAPSLSIDFNSAQVREPAFSPDGRTVAVPDTGGFVRLLDGNTFQEAAKLSGYMHGVHSLGFSADGSRLATGGTATEAITVWDMGSRERLLTIGARESQFMRTAFSPDGHVLVAQSGAGSNPGALYFWRAPSWAEIEHAEAAERAGAVR